MPLEVVVELQIRAISCPGVFLPDKEGVYLGVYLLNQYLETNCFPSVFPIVIQQSMRFEKTFENAIDPGAVAEILESFLTRFELIQLVSPVWEELAYYEENTRDFLFPEPKLTSSHLGMHREVLMKTAIGFPGIAPKLEFSTRTAIRECVFPHKNRFFVDSGNPFGENSLTRLQKSRRKSKFLDFAFPMRKASSLDSLAPDIKVTREPDERIVLRSQPPPPLDPRKSRKPSPCHQGDADFQPKTPVSTPQHSRSTSPLDQPLLQERFQPCSQSTWKKIHERVCSLLPSHRAHPKENFISETKYINERPSYPLKKHPLREQRYF
ncbi:spermatogenesis associated 6-like protein isoform X4 [Peromyscus leucopus]|uniref:spermatogenesis associated 6-like protein isoform X4 n=1 Tax=Peromyscus leucopus TaxID=10041 RepID=UPI001884B98B|nr:spermatogenesis associated 6-like protein isoform X4 [Peromyscus leucopus]